MRIQPIQIGLVALIIMGGTGCASTNGALPKDPFARGKAAMEQGRLDIAVKSLRQARDAQPERADVNRTLGVVLRRQGRYAEAIVAFQAVVAAEPEAGDDWLALGHLRFGLADYRHALEAYAKAATYDALDANGRVRRAMCAIQLDKAPVALQWLDEDKDRLNDVAAYHLARARAYVALTRPDEAIKAYRQCAALDKVDPTPESEAGAVYEALRFEDRAVAAYKRALKRNPEHLPTLTRLGRAYIGAGKAMEAIPLLERAKRIAPDSIAVRNNLGVAFSTAGMFEQAVMVFDEALAIDDRRPELHSNLAEAAYRDGRLKRAEAHLRRALKLDGTRQFDRTALRQVVLMRELLAGRCAGEKDTASVKARLARRWTSEGWPEGSMRKTLTHVMGDQEALALLDRGLDACAPTKTAPAP